MSKKAQSKALPTQPIENLIDEWHSADSALWTSSEENLDPNLNRFCSATDAIVGPCDQVGDLAKFANRVADYKEGILAEQRRLIGEVFPSVKEALRRLNRATIDPRGKCLGALARLSRRFGVNQPVPADSPREKSRMTVEEADKRGRLLKEQMGRQFDELSEREQAKRIGTTWPTWAKTALYINDPELKRRRSERRQKADERQQRGSPRVVSLTSQLEAVLSEEGEEERQEMLDHLIDDQMADYEPSPLDPSPRRVHVNRRR
jgi:hypothetical protein